MNFGKLAICGGGNGAHALAVVASQRFPGEIGWFTPYQDEARRIQAGLDAWGVVEGRADRIATVSDDASRVIPGADLVMLVAPAFAHGPLLKHIKAYLDPHAWVGVMPGRSGFELEASAILDDVVPMGERHIFAFQTLPWATRIREYGKAVQIYGVKAMVSLATIPGSRAPALADYMTSLVGTEIRPVPNILNVTLGNVGMIIHPAIMYSLFHDWDGRRYAPEEVPFSHTGVDEPTGGLMVRLSSEVLEVARAVERESQGRIDLTGVLPILEWFRQTYVKLSADLSTVARAFQTNAAFVGFRAPMRAAPDGGLVPDFQQRYMAEDVPYGLPVVRALADLLGVAMPETDRILEWAGGHLNRRFLLNGRVEGPDTQGLRIPQNYGLHTTRDLVATYERWN